MKCRFCKHPLSHEFVDLGHCPPSNSFLTREQLNEPEVTYPLRLFVCDKCWLVQVDEHKNAEEIFDSNYIYFSSFSSSWVTHARDYVDMISERLSLGADSHVIEVASNDGYLLQFFKQKNIPCLGIEPTKSTADACRKLGIEVLEDFFGVRLAYNLAKEARKADLILGNNVFAHVPDINDFVEGLKIVLADHGTVTLEFPHLMQLVQQNQFDTIYHEHFSYLSLYTTDQIFRAHGLRVYDVDEYDTHGGSLRVYGCHMDNEALPVSKKVKSLLAKEEKLGMRSLAFYQSFSEAVSTVKMNLLEFFIEKKRRGKTVMAYGAAAKGNTLLNYSGVRKDMLSCVADLSPHKVGRFLPGVHIPVVAVEEIKTAKPDYLLILPWNLSKEIMAQHSYIREWGGKFVTPIPELKVH